MSPFFATQHSGMKILNRPHRSRFSHLSRFNGALSLAAAALGVLVVSMLTGLAFAAWTANGPALLNALAASGLSWCL
ncbi:MAG: hypothetical protein RIC18_06805 [Hoeflea sp.]|uniref:hypothetical protein n=1 Tax=Hoeflea sp. TaxID=1940281 RepID=UPI0032EBEDFD